MRAIRVLGPGDPEVLRLEEIETPDPGPGDARIRVRAAGVNFIDIYERTGLYPTQTPFTPGREAAGLVEAVGPGVETVSIGDRVAFTMQRGSYAEAVTVPADRLVAVPEGIQLRTAAAVMLQGMTAHYLSHSTFPLAPGHTALVHAAAGGVGHLLVQMARMRGARVIATVSTEEKAELARRNGAHEVILYTQLDFMEETRRLTGGRGVDVVYDSVGRETFLRSLDCLAPRGMLALYGQSSGPVETLDPQILNRKGSLFLTRPSLAHYVADRDELLQRADDLFRWILDRSLEVRIDREWLLADAPEAHRYLEGRKTKGKLLLVP